MCQALGLVLYMIVFHVCHSLQHDRYGYVCFVDEKTKVQRDLPLKVLGLNPEPGFEPMPVQNLVSFTAFEMQ